MLLRSRRQKPSLAEKSCTAPFWSLRLVKGISVRCFGNIIPTVKLSLLIWFREMIGSDVVLLAGWISSLRTIPKKFNNVITNPPFSLAKEFAEKALEVSTGKVILFAKIQFLEGRQRKDFFATHPPKAVYVFSKRVNPLRNGLEVDENGKPRSSTMCFAWFVWEHGYTGEPCIRWI